MNAKLWKFGVLAIGVVVLHGTTAHAQWGYGWGGYGGGGQTPQGDMARGAGVLAAGAGQYNQETAVARSVNADTAMRWNQYMYQSQLEANRRYRQRMAREKYGNDQARAQIADRLRNNPDASDISSGNALNVAYDEISDPRVYAKSLKSAKVQVGGEAIRDIPFQYAAAAISTSIHQIMTKGSAPDSLKTPEFEAERSEIKALAVKIHAKIDAGENPDPADIDRALKVVEAGEAKVENVYPANSRKRNESMKYLKSLHGLLRMMETPAINLLLAGAEKRPEATLGELMMFMQAYNLRFGPATTARQKQVYAMLYPKLVTLRNEVAPALASAPAASTEPIGAAAGEMFSGMSPKDLKRKTTPTPPAPPSPRL